MRTYKTLATSLVLASALLLTGMASTAAASPITFTFSATQSSATTPTPGGLASLAEPFTIITGTITYDVATAASSSTATTATYPTGALVVNQFNVGTGLFVAPFSIYIENDFTSPSGTGDAFRLLTGGSTVGTPAGGYDYVALKLLDTGGLALTSTALPTSLSLFQYNELIIERISVAAGGSTTFLGATNYMLNSLQLQPADAAAVPEPTSLLLLGTGLAVVAARWRRRART